MAFDPVPDGLGGHPCSGSPGDGSDGFVEDSGGPGDGSGSAEYDSGIMVVLG